MIQLSSSSKKTLPGLSTLLLLSAMAGCESDLSSLNTENFDENTVQALNERYDEVNSKESLVPETKIEERSLLSDVLFSEEFSALLENNENLTELAKQLSEQEVFSEGKTETVKSTPNKTNSPDVAKTPTQKNDVIPESIPTPPAAKPTITTQPIITTQQSSALPAQNPPPLPTLADTTLQLINEFRAQPRTCGQESFNAATALTWNTTLESVALQHTNDMAAVNFFSHTGSDGLKVWDRATAAGYQYQAIGENIAAGYTTIQQVIEGWIDSPGHCANLMRGSFTEIGLTHVTNNSTQYGDYWTLVMGQQQ